MVYPLRINIFWALLEEVKMSGLRIQLKGSGAVRRSAFDERLSVTCMIINGTFRLA